MRIAVYGCGSMGLRHIRNILGLGHSVTAHDLDHRALAEAVHLGADPPSIAVEADGIVIATPANSHRLENCVMPHFVEKPLADNMVSAHVKFWCRGHEPPIQVGYQLRFDPDLIALREQLKRQKYGPPLIARVEFGQELPAWRPDRDYRQTSTARRDLGGGILLEASHELDLIVWLFGAPSEVHATARKLSNLDIEVEDAVVAFLDYGAFWVELHLDMLRPGYRRQIEIVCESGILSWRLNRSRLDTLYLEEMRHFVNCIETGAEPSPNLEDGLAALGLVERIRAASRQELPQAMLA